MSTAIADFAEVDTAMLEAALMGDSGDVRTDQFADLSDTAAEDGGEPELAGGDATNTDGQEGSSFSPEAAALPATAAVTEPNFSNLSEDEASALDIRQRNPDMSLDESLVLARHRLGMIQPDTEAEPKEPELSLQDRIIAIEAAIDEAGANDGLFTTEIANLTKEYSRLLSQEAVSMATQARHDEVRTAQMAEEREDSYQRAAAICPEALETSSAIGQSLSAVIAEAEATKNPLLYDPQAPELFLALANARLPEAQRIELKRPTATTQTPSDAPSAAAVQSATPSPAGVLPVAASVRTAQPATRMIDPSNVERAIKEAPTDILEAALLGERTNRVLLRL